MAYWRVYADSSGETHVGKLDLSFVPLAYAPPAPPFEATDFKPAGDYGLLRILPGWFGDWHPVPSRQLQIFAQGHLEAQVSDGAVLRCESGTLVLVEDTAGKGHKSWVVGEEEVVIFVVRLPDPG